MIRKHALDYFQTMMVPANRDRLVKLINAELDVVNRKLKMVYSVDFFGAFRKPKTSVFGSFFDQEKNLTQPENRHIFFSRSLFRPVITPTTAVWKPRTYVAPLGHSSTQHAAEQHSTYIGVINSIASYPLPDTV